jgi:hypothetical protein
VFTTLGAAVVGGWAFQKFQALRERDEWHRQVRLERYLKFMRLDRTTYKILDQFLGEALGTRVDEGQREARRSEIDAELVTIEEALLEMRLNWSPLAKFALRQSDLPTPFVEHGRS